MIHRFFPRTLRDLIFTSLFAITIQGAVAEELRVVDFGAIPNDGKDDTAAIRKAAAALSQKPGSKLIFEPGRYNLTTGPFRSPSVVFKECHDLTLEGNGAELVGSDSASLLLFSKCRNLTIRGLTVDWDPLPFTAGKVVAVGSQSFDLEPTPPHLAQGGRRVAAVFGYDPELHRGARGGMDLYQMDSLQPTELAGPGLLRCFVKGYLPKVGDSAIVRHEVYRSNAFTLIQCQQVRLENIVVYSAPGMGVYGSDCIDVAFSNVHVRLRPESNRWMSTTADATHLNNCRGSVSYEDCIFEGMGDDAINLHSMYMVLSERKGSREVTLAAGRKDAPLPLPEAGDKLEFLSPDTLQPTFIATVKSAASGDGKIAVSFDVDLPETISSGCVVGNASTCVHATIQRCKILRNRARGLLIQTRNVRIEDCVFEDISGAAIHLTSDAHNWWEGQSVRNVSITRCRFERCNYGAARGKGVIDIFAEIGKLAGPAGFHSGIRIEENLFVENEGAAVHASSVEDVEIRNNQILRMTRGIAVLDHCRRVQITGTATDTRTSAVEFGQNVERESVLVDGASEKNAGPGEGK